MYNLLSYGTRGIYTYVYFPDTTVMIKIRTIDANKMINNGWRLVHSY
jgi:hypothetical protein